MDTFFQDRIQRLTEALNNNATSSEEKSDLSTQLYIYKEVQEQYEWYSKTAEEKQATRIIDLASARKNNMRSVDTLEASMLLYSQITISYPFILCLIRQHLDVSNLLSLCEKEQHLVDYTRYPKAHVTLEEVEASFSPYFNQKDKLHPIFFKEATEQIDKLYSAFCRTIETSERNRRTGPIE